MNVDKKQMDLIVKRIGFLESTNMVCHQWSANELRTLIGYWDRKPNPTKTEKEFALINIGRIMKNYELSINEVSKVKWDEKKQKWSI